MAAEKRMMAINLIDDDAFLDLSQGAQLLYFHLLMRADDEGFLTPKKIMRAVGASKSSLSALVKTGFIIEFDTGVICIKHWLSHNSVRKDCFTPSIYPERELVEAVTVNGRKEYKLKERNEASTDNSPLSCCMKQMLHPKRTNCSFCSSENGNAPVNNKLCIFYHSI